MFRKKKSHEEKIGEKFGNWCYEKGIQLGPPYFEEEVVSHEHRLRIGAFMQGIIHFYYLDKGIWVWKHRYVNHELTHQTMCEVAAAVAEIDYTEAKNVVQEWFDYTGYGGWNEWHTPEPACS